MSNATFSERFEYVVLTGKKEFHRGGREQLVFMARLGSARRGGRVAPLKHFFKRNLVQDIGGE